jgi:hypothetical protein
VGVTDRVALIRKFGTVKPWLVDRVHAMSDHQWRLFYDQLEAGGAMPETFEDTMPRNVDDFISNPYSAPDQYRELELAKWRAWSEIWGPPPWECQKPIKPRPVPRWRD